MIREDMADIVLVCILLTLNRFHTFFEYFHSWLGTGKCLQGNFQPNNVFFVHYYLNEVFDVATELFSN